MLLCIHTVCLKRRRFTIFVFTGCNSGVLEVSQNRIRSLHQGFLHWWAAVLLFFLDIVQHSIYYKNGRCRFAGGAAFALEVLNKASSSFFVRLFVFYIRYLREFLSYHSDRFLFVGCSLEYIRKKQNRPVVFLLWYCFFWFRRGVIISFAVLSEIFFSK